MLGAMAAEMATGEAAAAETAARMELAGVVEGKEEEPAPSGASVLCSFRQVQTGLPEPWLARLKQCGNAEPYDEMLSRARVGRHAQLFLGLHHQVI